MERLKIKNDYVCKYLSTYKMLQGGDDKLLNKKTKLAYERVISNIYTQYNIAYKKGTKTIENNNKIETKSVE
jgi:hypothetical protein